LFSFFTPGFAADLWPSFVFAASPGLKIHEQLSVVGYRFLRLVDRFVKLNSMGVSPWSPVYIRQSEQGATPVDFLLASIRAGAPSLAVFHFSVSMSRALGPSLTPAPILPLIECPTLLILHLLLDFAQAHEA
jgi:hypothetical protein